MLYQWRKLVPTYRERLTRISGITVRNVKLGKSTTAFRIFGDKDQPVKDGPWNDDHPALIPVLRIGRTQRHHRHRLTP